MDQLLWQPIRSTPIDYIGMRPAAWRTVPDEPLGALCYQGEVTDGYDFYHVAVDGHEPVITSWVEKSIWTPERYAREARYPRLQADARQGGAINTCRKVTWYAEGILYDVMIARYARTPGVKVRRWKHFVPPTEHVRTGRLVDDRMWEATQDTRSVRGWREWTEGVADHLVKNGQVRGMRLAGLWVRPQGTRTYYHDDTSGAANFHNLGNADDENQLMLLPGPGTSLSAGNVGTNGKDVFVATTPVNEPDAVGVWPAGTYRRQLDIPGAGSDLTFGLLPQGNGDGHFARVNAALDTEVEAIQQAEGAFAGPGLHMATCSGWSVAGAQTDRYENLIASVRVVGMGNQTFSMQCDSDNFTDGPWVAAVGGGDPSLVGLLSSF